MLRRNVTILFLLLLVPCVIMGQTTKISKVAQLHKISMTEDQNNLFQVSVSPLKLTGTPVGESIGLTTQYDYWTNCIIRDQIVYWHGPKFANMVRPYPLGATTTVRHIVYTERDSATGVYTSTDVFGGQAGYPDIDVERQGANIGTIGVVGHTPDKLAIWDGVSSFLITQYSAGDDPSLQFGNANIWLATSGVSRDQYQFWSSPDGAVFTNWDSISAFKSNVFWQANGSTELAISKSPDETQVVYYGVAAGSATLLYANYLGYPVDSCDNFFTVATTNSGTTWTPKKIEIDGVKGEVVGYPNFAPLVRNVSQVDLAVTNSGVVHAVANGAGYSFNATDTTWMFPVIYYNSTTGVWKTISNYAIDTMQVMSALGTPTAAGIAANRYGNSYPSVAVSENGKFVYVMWTGIQLTNGKIGTQDTATDGGNIVCLSDLYHTWSTDGGTTWAPVTVLAGDKTISECWGHTPQYLRYDPVQQKYVADIVYLADLAPDVSTVPGQTGAVTDNPIMYYAFPIPVTVINGVNDKNQVVNSFNLQQNYPNPFNPSTKINYTLPATSNVSLKVYDMLGREVANLVNATQQAGQHYVTFDASKLASGVYVYTLRSNSSVMSKKMLLMK